MSKISSTSIYLTESKYAFIGLWRTPDFTLPTLAFPLLFYVFFGIVFTQFGPTNMSSYLVATYGTFGVLGAALFGFGNLMAVERDQGWLLLKQVSPMPTSAYFFAKLAMCTIFSVLILALLFPLAAFGGGVSMSAAQWASMFGILIAGTLPFGAMGLAIGAWVRGTSAAAVVNLIYLPMGLLSGLWIPIKIFPELMHHIARTTPAYHLSQLALGVIDQELGDPVWSHVLVPALQSLLFLGLAVVGFRRVKR